MYDYRERHVVVTGGTGALGSAVVQTLLDAGAICHVPYRDPADAERRPWARHPQVRPVAADDLADEAAVASLYGPLASLWASIHVVGGFAMAPITNTSVADWRRMMDMNALTCFLCCREAVRRMRDGGAGGRIVNIAARPALAPTGGMVAYAASKAAVASITQCLAEEAAADRILVNAVVPSVMDTPANRKAMPNADPGKWARVEDVAATIAFLASPQNALTRGTLVPTFGLA